MKKIFFLLILLETFALYSNENPPKIFAGSCGKEISQEIANYLKIPVYQIHVSHFNDGELRIKIDENVKNKNVYVIQSICSTANASVNENLMELYLTLCTLKRSLASHITAIIPYYGYARQDRKTAEGETISASDIAHLLETTNIDKIIAVDLHCGQIQGFFNKTVIENLSAIDIFSNYIAKKNLNNMVIVSPDAGGVDRAKQFITSLNKQGVFANFAIIIKQRLSAGVVDKMNIIGSVKDCDAIIIDDICDTGGTLIKAVDELKKHGAKKIFACITHPVFSNEAIKKLEKSNLTELIVTNTIPVQEKLPKNIIALSISPIIAEAIK
jgi:ribose-phosphate pyrophosphokinase